MKMKYASKRRRDQKKRGSGQVQQHTNKEHKHETRGEKYICQRLKLPLNKLENRQLRTNPQSQTHEKKENEDQKRTQWESQILHIKTHRCRKLIHRHQKAKESNEETYRLKEKTKN